MNNSILHSKIKSRDAAYFFWFILGSHYAYFGRWDLQILFWGTLGGFGVWALIDFFVMSNKVEIINASILKAYAKVEREKDVERAIKLQ